MQVQIAVLCTPRTKNEYSVSAELMNARKKIIVSRRNVGKMDCGRGSPLCLCFDYSPPILSPVDIVKKGISYFLPIGPINGIISLSEKKYPQWQESA